MSIFEILIVVLIALFVISNLYFSITGRIFNRNRLKIEDERAVKQMDWDEQVKALSLKCYEYQSEISRLLNENREWVANYNKMTFAYNEAMAELDKYHHNETVKKKETTKKKKQGKDEVLEEPLEPLETPPTGKDEVPEEPLVTPPTE